MLIDEYRLLAVENHYIQLDEVEVYATTFSSEIIYQGKGVISRNSDLRLSIVIWSAPTFSFEEKREDISQEFQEDKYVSQYNTCRMNARDQLGRWWSDCEILVTEIRSDTEESILKAEVVSFVLKVPKDFLHTTNEKKVEIISIHNGFLPYSFEKKDKSLVVDLSFFAANVFIKISKDIPCTKIVLRYKDLVDRIDVNVLLEVISISSGKVFTPLLMSWSDKEYTYLEVLHGETDNHEMLPISEVITPFRIQDFELFVECYLSTFTTPYAETYAAWHRAYLGTNSSIEISSLALCTAIEGIVKYRFTDVTPMSVANRDELENAIVKIIDLEAPDWLEEIILKNLQRVKEARPTIRKSLKNFSRSNGISNKQLLRWESLRNKIAHFDRIEGSFEENEKLIEDYNICLEIFFKLIASSTGYN
ncbi:hypothetical protein [Vreelandella venusta]|uniref:hypothetical protein n=1 Tax=Vreelandella venusta TaxID=44935 RepID=UPI003F67B26C